MDDRAKLAQLSNNCEQLIAGLRGELLVDALTAVGVETKGVVESAVVRDLGDSSFSGWRRGKPIAIAGRFDVFDSDAPVTATDADKKLVYRPTPRSRGPMRVLEQGRHLGQTGAVQGPGIVQSGKTAGQTRRRADGTVVVSKRSKRKRWNGYTRPLHTWSDASDLLAQRAPKVAERVIVNSIIRAMLHG